MATEISVESDVIYVYHMHSRAMFLHMSALRLNLIHVDAVLMIRVTDSL
jgi:hypothetical protein